MASVVMTRPKLGRFSPVSLAGNRTLLVIYITSFVFGFTAIAHESNLGATASLLVGDSATQYSRVIGVTMLGLAFGFLAGLKIKDRLIDHFLTMEISLTVLSGFSALLAFTAYTRLPLDYILFIYLMAFAMAALVGLEDGLVVRIAEMEENEIRRSLGVTFLMANVGGGLAGFYYGPHLFPTFGPVGTAVVLGIVDAVMVLFNLLYFRRQVTLARLKIVLIIAIGAGLLVTHLNAVPIHQYLNQSLFEDKIVRSWTNEYGSKNLTCWKENCKLYINGQLQFASKDEYMYHELLVAPALTTAEERINKPLRVLIAGGGDGLALREVLKYNVEHVTLVDLDPQMTQEVALEEPVVSYNQGSLLDPRVKVVNQDAFTWMMDTEEVFDVVILDLVDPVMDGPAKLYTLELYHRILGEMPGQGILSAYGIVVTQSVSPWDTPKTFWTIHSTLDEAAAYVTPYHYYIPSFGDWGFNMASHQPLPTQEMAIVSSTNQWLTTELWNASLVFDARALEVRGSIESRGVVSTIEHPEVLVYLKEEASWDN